MDPQRIQGNNGNRSTVVLLDEQPETFARHSHVHHGGRQQDIQPETAIETTIIESTFETVIETAIERLQ